MTKFRFGNDSHGGYGKASNFVRDPSPENCSTQNGDVRHDFPTDSLLVIIGAAVISVLHFSVLVTRRLERRRELRGQVSAGYDNSMEKS